MVDTGEIRADLLRAFPDAEMDLSGEDGRHYTLTISCAAFAGKSRIEQHRMVYLALKGKVGNELHALQLKTTVKE